MEIVDVKKVRVFVLFTIIIVIVFMSAPLLFYFYHFYKNGVSNQTSNWADFGSYFGGIVGTLLNLVAAFFSLISIYITLMIAKKIQEAEISFNIENKIKEKELTHIQNKPFPYIELSKFKSETKISLQNHGVGPLIVSKWYLVYKDVEEYSHFNQLLRAKDIYKPADCSIEINTAPTHIVLSGASKVMLKIFCDYSPNNFISFQKECHDILKEAVIHIDYEDIFSNKFSFERDFIFLGV